MDSGSSNFSPVETFCLLKEARLPLEVSKPGQPKVMGIRNKCFANGSLGISVSQPLPFPLLIPELINPGCGKNSNIFGHWLRSYTES